jgi:quinohemoprotein ethanol dehydrogenase
MDECAISSTHVKRPIHRQGFRLNAALYVAVSGVALLGCALAQAEADGRAIADEKQGADWLSYGRTYSENRYSPLTSINENNVKSLGLAWYLDLPNQGTLEGTPLAVNGTLYFSGTYGKTFAVDARTGRKLWEFDPNLGANPQKLRLNMGAHRGVAYWKDRVYVGMNDGRLIALNAKDGMVVWSVQTTALSKGNPKFISGAPRVFNGKVVIGHGSAEAGTRGYASAYDADTGRLLWRFDTIPHGPAKGLANPTEVMAAKTWTGNPDKWGGGSVWDSIVYDPDLNRVYLATGNGNPINAAVRSPGGGDNLFLCSIVALDADTGRYLWHYQINPRDSWDYDATQQLVLADLTVAGHLRKVLMQAPKDGFFYVIDRATGKLISAQKYAKVTWATRIDLKSGRPVEIRNSHYEKSPVVIWPSGIGAHNWQPMSFDPHTGLVYIPVLNLGMGYGPTASHNSGASPDDEASGKPGRLYSTQVGAVFDFESFKPDADDGTGALLAWDPVAQKPRWKVRYDSFWNGGTLASAGNLVFQGTGRGQFIAYRASSGEKLWSFDAGLGIIAAPMTYAVDGTQYVSILVGYGGMAGGGGKLFDYGWRFGEQPRRLLTFSLGRNERLPASPPPRFKLNAVDDSALAIDAQQAADGAKVYAESFCAMCHGDDLGSVGSIAPDLRESRLALNWQAFRDMLHEGSLVSAGMPKFDDLSDVDMRALYMYIRQHARESIAQESR